MQVQITKINISDIPTLHIVQTERQQEPLPTVLYYHGYNGEKESSLTIAYKIAEKGMRVILPDGYLHGEREGNISLAEKQLQFGEIIARTMREMELVKTYIEEQNWVLDGRIGVGGTSMGGMITYAALRSYEWIKAAVVLMGSAYVTKRIERLVNNLTNEHEKKLAAEKFAAFKAELASIDLTNDLSALNERPLLIWHGAQDAVIPVEESRSFYEAAKPLYRNAANIEYIEEADRIHNISKLSISKTAAWFAQHL